MAKNSRKLMKMDRNGWTWLKVAGNALKWSEIVSSGRKWPSEVGEVVIVVRRSHRWPKMAKNSLKMAENGQKWLDVVGNWNWL